MREEKGRINGQIIYFISYLCLVYGILLSAVKFKQMNTIGATVFVVVLLTGGVLFLSWAGGRKFYLLTGIILSGTVGYFLVGWLPIFFRVREKLPFLFPLDKVGRGGNLLAEAAFFLSLFCFFLIFLAKKGWLFYGFTFFVLLLGPIYGFHPGILEIFLLFLFHLGDSVYRMVFFEKKKPEKKQSYQIFTAGQGILISAVFFLAAYFLAISIPKSYRRNWMEESARLQQVWENIINQKSQKETQTNPGIISHRNNYPLGSEELEVHLSVKPEDSLYLKNYTASSYLGNQWKEADETRFYEKMRENTQFSRYYTSPSYFERRQFELVQYGKLREWRAESRNRQQTTSSQMLDDYRKWSGMETITIRPLSQGKKERYYTPYISSYNSRDSEGGYCFSWYPWKDYLAYRNQEVNSSILWLKDMEEAYQNFAEEEYLSVPKDLLPRLWELCSTHPVSSPKEATEFILQTLREQASYSLTPGFMPYRTDVAEYFLFEGQSGYCQHFATAAALMYRMYGIPSRYVTGYLASPNDFLLQEDGTYLAVLTDQQAHAWVEIYLSDFGWVPVEVTPPSEELLTPAGGNRVQHSDQEEKKKRENTEDIDTEEEEDSLSMLQEKREEKDWGEKQLMEEDTAEPFSEMSEYTKHSGNLGQKKHVFIMWLGIILLGFLLTKWISSWKNRQFCQLGADEVYQKIVLLFQTNEKLRRWNGMEPGFAQAVAEEWKAIPAEELKQIQKIAMYEAFGRDLPSEQERETVREEYQLMYCRIMQQLKGLEKLKFRLHNVMPRKGRKKNGDKQGNDMDSTQCS